MNIKIHQLLLTRSTSEKAPRTKRKQPPLEILQKIQVPQPELTLILLFQSETLKYIREKYGITNSDFKVLCAARLYKVTKKISFRPYFLADYLQGMWTEQIYKSFRNLERKRLIDSYKDVGFKTYYISREGDSCLKSYAKVFDEVFGKYIEEIK